MAFINGEIRILYFKINGSYIPVGCLTDNSFSESAGMLPTTTRDNTDGWESARPINQNYSISFSGLVTTDFIDESKVNYQRLRQLKRQRTLIEWKIDDGQANYDYGNAYITNLSDSAAIDENVSFDGSLQGYGEPYNYVDNIYFTYKEFVESKSGTLSSERCTQNYIERITT